MGEIFADIYKVSYNKVKESLSMVGLESASKTPASKLSKGMRNRLQLARVFMHTPKIIFLDEPTSGLDLATSKSIHKMIFNKKISVHDRTNIELPHSKKFAEKIYV